MFSSVLWLVILCIVVSNRSCPRSIRSWPWNSWRKVSFQPGRRRKRAMWAMFLSHTSTWMDCRNISDKPFNSVVSLASCLILFSSQGRRQSPVGRPVQGDVREPWLPGGRAKRGVHCSTPSCLKWVKRGTRNSARLFSTRNRYNFPLPELKKVWNIYIVQGIVPKCCDHSTGDV